MTVEERDPGRARRVTDVVEIGMEIRWIRVRVRPMARPANPLGRPDLRLHDLRHSGAVLAAPDGCHAGR